MTQNKTDKYFTEEEATDVAMSLENLQSKVTRFFETSPGEPVGAVIVLFTKDETGTLALGAVNLNGLVYGVQSLISYFESDEDELEEVSNATH